MFNNSCYGGNHCWLTEPVMRNDLNAYAVKLVCDLAIPDKNECVFIEDSRCNQCIVNIKAFLIYTQTGIFYDVGGALAGMEAQWLELVNDAYTLATLPNNDRVIFHLNQAFYNEHDKATEALFTPHQLHEAGLVMDNCAKWYQHADGLPGGQYFSLPDSSTLDMHFSSCNCVLCFQKPQASDLHKHPIVKLTLSQQYEPNVRRSTIQQGHFSEEQLHDWRAHLGYPTFDATKATFENTTQFVKTLEARMC